jgi:hypothetical protein
MIMDIAGEGKIDKRPKENSEEKRKRKENSEL